MGHERTAFNRVIADGLREEAGPSRACRFSMLVPMPIHRAMVAMGATVGAILFFARGDA